MVKPTNAVKRHQKHVKGIDKELLVCDQYVAVCDDSRGERTGGEERDQREGHIHLGCPTPPPNKPNVNAPSSGVPRRTRNSMLLIFLQGLEVFQIQIVELFPNLEKEHAKNEHRHQDIKRDTQLNDHRHTVSGAHRTKE